MVLRKARNRVPDHSISTAPTFNEVSLVKDILQSEGLITEKALHDKLKGKIKSTALKKIIEYFEKEHYIYIGEKGINWILNENPKFKKILAKTTIVR